MPTPLRFVAALLIVGHMGASSLPCASPVPETANLSATTELETLEAPTHAGQAAHSGHSGHGMRQARSAGNHVANREPETAHHSRAHDHGAHTAAPEAHAHSAHADEASRTQSDARLEAPCPCGCSQPLQTVRSFSGRLGFALLSAPTEAASLLGSFPNATMEVVLSDPPIQNRDPVPI